MRETSRGKWLFDCRRPRIAKGPWPAWQARNGAGNAKNQGPAQAAGAFCLYETGMNLMPMLVYQQSVSI
jgi:hypothetical protein